MEGGGRRRRSGYPVHSKIIAFYFSSLVIITDFKEGHLFGAKEALSPKWCQS